MTKRRKLLDSRSVIQDLENCECGGKFDWDPSGPSAAVKEILDNGAMPKAVERFADAERLYHERAKDRDPLAGKSKRRPGE